MWGVCKVYKDGGIDQSRYFWYFDTVQEANQAVEILNDLREKKIDRHWIDNGGWEFRGYWYCELVESDPISLETFKEKVQEAISAAED